MKLSLLRIHVYVWIPIIIIQVSRLLVDIKLYSVKVHGGLAVLIACFYFILFMRIQKKYVDKK